jgi:hypothetical protein
VSISTFEAAVEDLMESNGKRALAEMIVRLQGEVCLCGASEPDSFGNRDQITHPDCPTCAPVRS